MNYTHPDILTAEKYGMPERPDENEICEHCSSTILENDVKHCAECKRLICPRCDSLVRIDLFEVLVCGPECAEIYLRAARADFEKDMLRSEREYKAEQNCLSGMIDDINKQLKELEDNG